MSEQLNERERWLIEVATAHAWGCGGAMEPMPTTKELIDKIMRRSVDCPPDPRDAELSALRAEVERLSGLLDEVCTGARYLVNEMKGSMPLAEVAMREEMGNTNFHCLGMRVAELDDILSRRTAERKERGE